MPLSAQEVRELLQATTKEPLRKLPSNFNKAALFLLDLQFDNLFEPCNALDFDHYYFRCKGCNEVVTRTKREEHFKKHKRETEF